MKMKTIILLLVCCFLFGCKEYSGIRICKKNTNECIVYPNNRYNTNVHYHHVNGYCDRNTNGRVTIEDVKNSKVFEVYSCQEYDVYPVWR